MLLLNYNNILLDLLSTIHILHEVKKIYIKKSDLL